MIKAIGFTVYAVTDMAQARAFYEGKLGLKPNSEYDGEKSKSWVEYDLGQATFAIGSNPDWKPSQDGAAIAFEVDDFDATVADLKKGEVAFMMEPAAFPTCSMAIILDPDKNKLIVHKKK